MRVNLYKGEFFLFDMKAKMNAGYFSRYSAFET